MAKKMKTCVVAATLLFAMQLFAQSPANPIQIALLRWYSANLVTQIQPCMLPQGLAFDGSHIWVACGPSGGGGTANALVEYNAADGAHIQTVMGVPSPFALLYDGANIWATNLNGNNSVTEVNAVSGVTINTVPVGSNPHGLAFDGTYIWVSNYGSDSVTQILASTATVVNTYHYPGGACSHPFGEAYDGTYLWVVCYNSNFVVAINTTGSSIGTIQNTVIVGQFPQFIAYDGEVNQPSGVSVPGGAAVWVTNSSSGTVSRIQVVGLLRTDYGVGNGAHGVVFDGTYIWVGNGIDDTVTKLVQSTGGFVGTYPPSSGPGLPLGGPLFLAFDGGNIWISNSSGSTVSKF